MYESKKKKINRYKNHEIINQYIILNLKLKVTNINKGN